MRSHRRGSLLAVTAGWVQSDSAVAQPSGAPNPTPPAPVRSANSAKTNVIYIVLDDMGFSDLGCYGSEIKTPNIDELAANGLVYNNFCTTPCLRRAARLF